MLWGRGLTVRSKHATLGRQILNHKILYFILLPVLLNFIIFHYLPMFGVTIAFRDYHPAYPISQAPWIGLEKFKNFFSSYYFWNYTGNTLLISLASIIIGFPLPILLALLINEIRARGYKKVLQTVTYMPYFISSVIIVGLVNMLLNPTDGIINQAVRALGGDTVLFMEEPGLFLPVYLTMGIWQGAGFGAIIYLAAISGIDAELYEAAVLDGAGRMARMWHITVKSIMPVIAIQFIMRLGSILNVGWTEILLMQNPMNIEASEVIQTYVYKRGIVGADYSYATAVGLMMSLIGFALVIGSNAMIKKMTDSEMSLF